MVYIWNTEQMPDRKVAHAKRNQHTQSFDI